MVLALLILSFSGFLIALYFTLVDRGMMQPDARWIPRVCRMEKGDCTTILRTREARMFGVPNFHVGLMYYGLLMWASIVPEQLTQFSLQLQILSGGTVAAGVYLTYTLLWKLKVTCTLCLVSHGINLTLFLILLITP